MVLILLLTPLTSKVTATYQRDTTRLIIIREIHEVTKQVDSIRNIYAIAWVALQPQKAFSQFSDSTIREINNRLIELHECRQKQALYEQLAVNDGNTIHRQDSTIQALIFANDELKIAKSTYQKLSAFSSVLLLLAIIL